MDQFILKVGGGVTGLHFCMLNFLFAAELTHNAVDLKKIVKSCHSKIAQSHIVLLPWSHLCLILNYTVTQ